MRPRTRVISTTSPRAPRAGSASSPSTSTRGCRTQAGDWRSSSPTRRCQRTRPARCFPIRCRWNPPFTTRRAPRCSSARSRPSDPRCSSRRFASTVAKGEQVVAVVSAMGHTTDRLITLARSVNAEPSARELDMLVANGETITAPLVAMCLQGMGVPAVSLSGLQAGVRTSAHHSSARIHDIRPDRILQTLEEGKVAVVAGFQGVTEELEVTTLGRGGSDTTAVALAAALGARASEIYTDVDGNLTAYPRVVT